MEGFTPLFGRIVNSSVWDEPDFVVKVFLTMLAVKDRDHVVRLSAYNLARLSRKTEAEVLQALEVLASPDTKRLEPQPNEGRRIERQPDGWLVLNGEFYQDLMFKVMHRARNAAAMRERRAREKGAPQAPVTPGQKVYEQALETHGAEHAAINAGGDKGAIPVPAGRPKERDFAEEIYQAYPRRVGKPAAKLKIRKALASVPFEKLLELTIAYAQAVNGQDPQFIPHPATWFHQQRFNDDPSTWTRKENGRVADPSRFNPNAQLAGAQTDDYAVLGASIGAGEPEPAPDSSEPPPE